MPQTDPAMSPRFTVAMLAYPGLTLLDLVGPQAVWGMYAETYLVWETLHPIVSDSGVTIVPTHTFDTCPRGVDILFVPGGVGGWDVMENEAAIQFLCEQAEEAQYVTSVCGGSIILAAAGLLEGHRAATHWATYDLLEELGVQGVRERVVTDGNRITGGGVTAGIDFGLTILATLRGEEVAKMTQLMLEYDPKPPFDAGSPERAGEEIVGRITAMFSDETNGRVRVAMNTSKQRLAARAAVAA